MVPVCLCDEGTCRKTPLLSTIAGKSQNLSDVRSEACAVDWFSYYAEYSLLMNLEEDERFIFVWLICLRFANNESAKMSIKSSFMEIVFSLCIQQNEVPGQILLFGS